MQLDALRMGQLRRYRDWLATEAERAGGIGPEEVNRLERRHIADSLLFLHGFPDEVEVAWDLGSGVGLPGIPLAITRPDIEFTLVDRSGRRVDLLKRVIRLLELSNCEVAQAEIASLSGQKDVLVARASLPPAEMRSHVPRLVHARGRAILAGSWQSKPDHDGWVTVEIPSEVLDQAVWLLMMQPE